jgi:hypothetical protein
MKLMGSSRSTLWAARLLLVAIGLVAVIAQSGCGIFPTPQTSISGHVYGDPLVTSPAAAPPRPLALRATITCNAAATTSGSDGSYSLSVDQTDQYSCTISAPTYVTAHITLSATAGTTLHLDIGTVTRATATPTATPTAPVGGSTTTTNCANLVITPTVTCPPLHLKPGTINGVVTSADTQQPLSGATVKCWQPVARGQTHGPFQTGSTGATGAFGIAAMAAGPYGCVVPGDSTLYSGTLQPGGTAALAIQVCGRHCPPVSFHDGDVMHAMTAYLVFWLPRGQTFEPAGSDTRFETLVAQYFNDIGGSTFYGLLTQYWDYQGSVINTVTLGGTFVDTTAYPHAGTHADPLSTDDIQKEVEQAIRTNGWVVDPEHEVFIFTGYNIQSCDVGGGGKDCSFSSDGRHYCAYHNDFPTSAASDNAIYAYMPVVADCVQLNGVSSFTSPNHDAIADALINFTSHEHFESVSDPYGKGWFDTDPSSGEIGDKCEYRFGTIRADGSNVTLGHGHSYLLQGEWSNHAGGCAFQ